MRGKSGFAIPLFVLVSALALAGTIATAHASPGDATTPAGTGVGSVVVFGPAVGTAPGIAAPRGMILVPTPATGSLVLPVQTSPVSGSGPSIIRYMLVIPGPNPAQNTGVALELQLSITIGTNGQVTVYPVPPP